MWTWTAIYHDAVLRYGPGVTRGSQFYLPPTHKPYLPLLPSHKASPPFGLYLLPTKGWPGWVDLDVWLHTEINVLQWELNLDTVTHPSTNRARHRLTSLIETNVPPLRWTTVLILSTCLYNNTLVQWHKPKSCKFPCRHLRTVLHRWCHQTAENEAQSQARCLSHTNDIRQHC